MTGDKADISRRAPRRSANVLLLVVDDQRADTLGALGNRTIRTPNLDRLARRGCWLRPYTTVPVCTPARAELLTGCNAFTNGCRWFGEPIRPALRLLPQVLAEAGYHCVHIGKWHNDGHPRDRGYHLTRRVMDQDLVVPYYRGGDTWRGTHDFTFDENGWRIRGHSTDLFAEAALDFLHQAPREPWFCFLGFHSPHDPRTAPGRYATMYDPATMPLPANFLPEHPFNNGDMLIRDELLETFPRRPEAIRRHLADYYGMITHHDHQIGRVLRALERTGQARRTLVIFTSDHGLAIGSHGLMGKENLYEHSVRVPLLIAGPGIPRGRRLDESCLCTHYDFMPTLLELLGLAPPSTCEGTSYAGVLRGEQSSGRKQVFAAYRDCMRMVRDRRFKLNDYLKIGRCQLFDLQDDPQELHDLLVKWRRYPNGNPWPFQPKWLPKQVDKILVRLQKQLAGWQRSVGDTWETTSKRRRKSGASRFS